MWALGCSVGIVLLLRLFTPFVYAIIDDRTMMEMVSGQYLGTPDAHTIFMGYGYSLLVAGLYRLCPNVDWYALLFLALQVGCIALVLSRLFRNGWRKGICGLLAFFFCARTLTQPTFTTTAAVLGTTLIFWYLTTKEFRIKDLVIIGILSLLTFEIRSSVFYMVLPVCAAAWLFRIIKKEERSVFHFLVPVVALGSLLVEFPFYQLGYGSQEWQDFNAYAEAGGYVYDYGVYSFPRYEDETAFYNDLGIEKKSRAKNLYYYNFLADDRIDEQFFFDYLDARREVKLPELMRLSELKRTVKEYIKDAFTGGIQYRHTAALLLYLALIAWCLWRKKYQKCLRAAVLCGVQILLWIHLIFWGRFPDRVQTSMNLMFLMVAFLLWAEELREIRISTKTQKGLAVLAALLLAVFSGLQVRSIREENLEMWSKNESVEALKEYCMAHPENIYFNDVTSLAMSSYNVHLWTQEPLYMNYSSLGDWVAFCPTWEKKMEQEDITGVPEALYSQDNVYLISSFDRGVEYLTELYDGVECTEVDMVREFGIYHLTIDKESFH